MNNTFIDELITQAKATFVLQRVNTYLDNQKAIDPVLEQIVRDVTIAVCDEILKELYKWNSKDINNDTLNFQTTQICDKLKQQAKGEQQ